LEKREKQLNQLIKENERLRTEMEGVLKKEKHKQQVELLREQNRVSEEKYTYLKDMERKIKQTLIAWKKSEDKELVMKEMFALLFKKNEVKLQSKMQKKLDARFDELEGSIEVGSKVKMRRNHQVGQVLELRGKRAVVKIGLLPMQVDLQDLVLIKEKSDNDLA
jgi:DNA mismatch repair protein MutS2